MRIGQSHLCYCTNIHPGESWPQVRAALGTWLPKVKARVSPHAPMGVGLRLSDQASKQLMAPEARRAFMDFLLEHDLYVYTINGFPYDTFHSIRVGEQVYRPNWFEKERLEYTNRLADILAYLLPDFVTGSISTVPGAYRAHLGDESDLANISENLLRHAAHLHALYETTGRLITLALEPDPDCLLQNSADAVDFFTHWVFSERAIKLFSTLCNLSKQHAATVLRRHMGLCLDVCHMAVLFEEPAKAIAYLQKAGIPLHKIQLSAALKVPQPNADARKALASFSNGIYLHQVAGRSKGRLFRWPDLSDALSDPIEADEWRIHLHVPLWAERIGMFTTTIDAVDAVLAMHQKSPLSPHLEIETYTWDVLQNEHRHIDLTTSIADEFTWVKKRL